jgi:hypothetical protein
LTNCTLFHNVSGEGGGLYVDLATVTLTDCTISGNFAFNPEGGGIYHLPPQVSGGILNLINTIVAGNVVGQANGRAPEPDITGRVTTADHNLVGDGYGSTGIDNGVNGNIVGDFNGSPLIDAHLGGLGNNGGPTQTMALLPGSPAIGHADNSKAPARDQRGVTRLDTAGETTDIGAFELTGTGSASATAFSLTPLGTAPAAGIPVNTVPAGEVATGNVANPEAQARRVPFQNEDGAIRRTLNVVSRTTPRKGDNQKIAAADELFAWNMSRDLFGAWSVRRQPSIASHDWACQDILLFGRTNCTSNTHYR